MPCGMSCPWHQFHRSIIKIYTKLNVIVKEVKDSAYKILISKNYPDFNLFEND